MSHFRDSVTSVGLTGRTLPFTSHNAVVKTFRQALALDERRAKFRHNPWSRPATDVTVEETSKPASSPLPNDSNEKVEEDRFLDYSVQGSSLWAKMKRTIMRSHRIDTVYYWDDSSSTSSAPAPTVTEEKAASKTSFRDKMKKVTRGRKKLDNALYREGRRPFVCSECEYGRSTTDSREV